MMAKLALALGALAVWVGLGFAFLSVDAGHQADAISESAQAPLDSALDALTRAEQAWLSARLDEAQAAASALWTEKNSANAIAPFSGRGRNRAALAAAAAAAQPASDQPMDILVSRAQTAVQRLPGAPVYAVVSGKGAVVGGTLWPDGQSVRAEPSVGSALLGVARVSFWRKDSQLFVLASAPLIEGGVPKGALVLARALGKETCADLATATHAPFALLLAKGKIACSVGADAAALLAASGHATPVVLPQANAATPMFVDAATVGIVSAARTFRPELPGSEIVAGIDVRPAFAHLAAAQQHALVMHAILLVPIAIFVLFLLFVLVRPVDTLTNTLSLQLQQSDKHVSLDERQFSGRMQRLAKNINALAARTPNKSSNTGKVDVASMLGHTVDIPSAALPPRPAVPATPERSPLFDDDDFEPTTAMPVAAILASPPPPAKAPQSAPAPLAPLAPKPKAPPAAASREDDYEPTLISRSLPTDSLRFDASLNSPAASLFDGLDEPVSPSAAQSLANEIFANEQTPAPGIQENSLFGDDDQRFSTLPDLPENSANSALSTLSGLEADSALSALQDTDDRQAPSAPRPEPSTIIEAPPEAPPAGVSPWDEPAPVDDPDMAHFHEVYDQFVRTRAQCGEGGELPLDRFIDKLKKSRDQVLQKQGAARVRFQVYVKDGKAALKAVAFR